MPLLESSLDLPLPPPLDDLDLSFLESDLLLSWSRERLLSSREGPGWEELPDPRLRLDDLDLVPALSVFLLFGPVPYPNSSPDEVVRVGGGGGGGAANAAAREAREVEGAEEEDVEAAADASTAESEEGGLGGGLGLLEEVLGLDG